MRFEAKIKKLDGSEVTEPREASDRFELSRSVRRDGGTLVSAKEISSSGGSIKFNWFGSLNEKISSVTLYEKVVFANNLSEMIKAGLPMSKALSVLERQTKNPKMKSVTRSIAESINKGDSLSTALSRFPNVFSEMFVAMTAAGEESGNLPQSLKIVGDQYSKTYALRKKVRGAMMYPMVVIVAMIIIGIILMVTVLPTLLSAFTEMKATLPASTRFLIWFSGFFSSNYITFAVLALGAIVFLIWFRKTTQGKLFFSKMSVMLPGVGPITQNMNSSVTARSLSSLLAAGVEVVEAIKITEKIVSNVCYKKVLASAAEQIQKGATLSSIFNAEEKLYPVLVGAMAEVGEETGKMADMLMNVAIYYEDEVDNATKNISSIIEPVLIVVVGAAVAFFAVSIISPLYSIGQQI
jgi:type IV pilus assembly protein PilC